MKQYCGILLFISSIVYSLAFLFNDYLWWLVFVFPISFLCVAMQERLSFKHGFVWGLSLLLLHMIGGICVVAHMAHNSWLYGLILALSMVIVQAVLIGILFWVVTSVVKIILFFSVLVLNLLKDRALKSFNKFRTSAARNGLVFTAEQRRSIRTSAARNGLVFTAEQRRSIRTSAKRRINFEEFKVASVFYKLLTGITVLFIAIFWLDKYCLFIFDVVEGYPLMHPLLVLTRCPPLLYLLPIIGKNCLTLLFLLLPTSITALFVYKNKLSCLLSLCALLPWCISLWFGSVTQQTYPEWVKHITVMPYMMINHCVNAQSAFHVVQHDINNFVNKHANHLLYILPESSICVDEKMCSIGTLMTQNKNIIFGATRMHDSACFNMFYWICKGTVRYNFAKRHAMVLSERMPFFLRNEHIKSMYFDDGRHEASIGMVVRQKIIVDGVGSFVPYICSEFFFAEYPDDPFNDTSILVLVNDSVFLQYPCSRYICELLRLLAQFKAMQWQREVIYVSYSQSFYCDKRGYVWKV